MKFFLLLIFHIFCFTAAQAQTYEIGLFAGGSNFIGDVGSTKYIAPNKPAFGGVFKWNRSARHSIRLSVIYTELEGMDSKSHEKGRKQRNYSFTNDILEASLGLEFTFLDFNLHSRKTNATPYLYTGVSVAKHDNFHFNNSGKLIDDGVTSYAYGIPMVIGYKQQVATNFVLAAEIGARYTFTDEIDGSVPDNKDIINTYAFGNLNNNDWYVFTGITLTYTFGKTPCYCAF